MSIPTSEPMDTASADPSALPSSKPSMKYRQRPKASNSRGRRDDAFRMKIGKKVENDFHAQRSAKFTSNLPTRVLYITP